MNLPGRSWHQPDYPDSGVTNQGNVNFHKERRFRCWTFGKTFTATGGTPFYHPPKDQTLVLTVITLLAHGCPPPAPPSV